MNAIFKYHSSTPLTPRGIYLNVHLHGLAVGDKSDPVLLGTSVQHIQYSIYVKTESHERIALGEGVARLCVFLSASARVRHKGVSCCGRFRRFRRRRDTHKPGEGEWWSPAVILYTPFFESARTHYGA